MAICTYRRKAKEGYRWYTVEVVPDINYSDDDQTVMLCIKDVHDIYVQGQELEEVNIQNHEIINALGEFNFGIYVIDLDTGALNPVQMSEDIKDKAHQEIQEWERNDGGNCGQPFPSGVQKRSVGCFFAEGYEGSMGKRGEKAGGALPKADGRGIPLCVHDGSLP